MALDDTSFDSIICRAIETASSEERAAFIAQACGSDLELRRRVERLVVAHFQAGSFLEPPPAPATTSVASAPSTDVAGTVIGQYKLLQPIGEGGMGTVYMAEQTQPVRRTVALKLIKAGMDTRQVLARFGAERQALALMDHPNIAKVLDVGATGEVEGGGWRVEGREENEAFSPSTRHAPRATPSGRPYFVMELIKGMPITTYCDEKRLTPRERLELFIPVCQAVQHAHQKGIIHRDLKPSNVLVGLYESQPVPKVIDFGVAKATGQKLTEATLFTGFGSVIGTPEYMSPEQAQLDNVDIDTRSDIYSLGVLLYELVTGTTPLDRRRLGQAVLLEVLRVIREEEPERPSTRLSTTEELPSIAACRNIEPRKLSGLVRGELDWIVMKALEKDRNRRYATANSLAADLRRYLDDEPVQAGPPSARYRFRKFARRNKVALTTAALVTVALVLGTVVSTWQGLRATRAERQAQTQLYFSRIALAERELAANHGARAEELLDQCRIDQRGWEWHFLKRRMHEEPVALLGHTQAAGGVAFSPDGQVLASASFDGTVRFWSPKNGRFLGRLDLAGGQSIFAKGATFSPDGQYLGTGSLDGTVKITDLAAGRSRVLKGHTGRVAALAFSPDGRHVASAGDDGTVIIWDLTRDAKRALSGHGAAVNRVAYSPDGMRLASASDDQSVRLWDVRTGQPLLNLTGHQGGVSAVAFSPDGRFLSTGGEDRIVRIWDAATGDPMQELRGHDGPVTSLVFSPDGRRLVSASQDTTVRVWDPATGHEAMTLRDHLRSVLAVVFSRDGQYLAAASFAKGNAAVRVWNATPLTEDVSHEVLRVLTGHRSAVTCVAFSPNGSLLASGSADKTVRIQDATTGEVRHILRDQERVADVTFSPDETHVAACGENGYVQVWNIETGRDVFTRQVSPYGLTALSYRADGQRLALAHINMAVQVLDAITGQDTLILNGEIASMNAVAFSPDGQHLASVGDDRTLHIWDTKTKKSQVILGHEAGIHSVAYHPDGKSLATASDDGLVIVWDAAAPKKVASFRAHRDAVNMVRFSSDGRRLATASRDGTVKCWDATTARLLCLLRAHQQEVWAVAFHPDGRHLASAGADGTVKIWAVPASPEPPGQAR
jgi:WD40 repeat protein/serine/threonine protein kinase